MNSHSTSERKTLWISLIAGMIISGIVIILILAAPNIKASYNNWKYSIQKADDITDYETLKKVEDTCRSYITSYEADKITYETNKNLDSEEARTLANAARTRANRTAAVYNTYYLQNSYVWKDNIPADIKAELQYLE